MTFDGWVLAGVVSQPLDVLYEIFFCSRRFVYCYHLVYSSDFLSSFLPDVSLQC